MDELAKTEARNYLSAAGFFVGASFVLLLALSDTFVSETLQLITGFGLLLIGILLIVLRKRDMIAMLFMMLAFIHLPRAFIPDFPGFPILFCFGGVVLLTLLVTLTGKDKTKWLLFILPLLIILSSIVGPVSPIGHKIILWIQFAVNLYFALACASERLNLPGRRILTADEETDFKASGSVLGYILFAIITGTYVAYYLVGESMMRLEYLITINLVAAVLMVVVSVLLLTVGKMRFTPVMFMLAGLLTVVSLYVSGTMMLVGMGILFIIVGIFAVLRKESRLLPGIMLIVYGCTGFFSVHGNGTVTPVVSFILNTIPCLIAIYLAFVVYSQKKLPKF